MTATAAPIKATLFYTTSGRQKGWLVSYRTPVGFQHIKVAGPSSARPSVDELLAKGYAIEE